MPRKHYHVGNGQPGCLFDNAVYCQTRKEADAALRQDRNDMRDCYGNEEQFRLSGSIRAGLIVATFGNYGAQRYAERWECTDDCDPDDSY